MPAHFSPARSPKPKPISLRSLRQCILAPWHFLSVKIFPKQPDSNYILKFRPIYPNSYLYTYFLTLLRVPIFKATTCFTQRDVTIATTSPAFSWGLDLISSYLFEKFNAFVLC